MYIIIVGAGEVGTYLSRVLVQEDHDVVLIERDEDLAAEVEKLFDVLVIHGNGISGTILNKAGIARADLFIAVTRIDEVNLLACMTARKMGKHLQTIARVREQEYISLTKQELKIDLMVNPEQASADEIIEMIHHQSTGQIWNIANDKLVFIDLPLTKESPFVFETIKDLQEFFPKDSIVVGKNDAENITLATDDMTFKENEHAYVLTRPEHVNEFTILSGNPWHNVEHVLIIGCGSLGLNLAQKLEERKINPTIIEQNSDRASWVSRQLNKSIVLQGDGTNPDILESHFADNKADAVVVLLSEDEKSIFVGLLANQRGARKVIVRSDKISHIPIANKLGIASVISPQRTITRAIINFIHKGLVSNFVVLGDHNGEVLELTIPQSPKHSEILTKPLGKLPLPPDTRLCALMRQDDVIVFNAESNITLQPDDILIVVALTKTIPVIEDYLGS